LSSTRRTGSIDSLLTQNHEPKTSARPVVSQEEGGGVSPLLQISATDATKPRGRPPCPLRITGQLPLQDRQSRQETLAGQIAEQSGVSTTFIGTALLGIATSLPELVTAIAAVRLGAFDLAVGNLFGSNAFNMAAFFFVDIAYQGGPIFNVITDAHAMTAFWGILLMSAALMGIIYRVEKRYMLIEPDSFAIILGYCIGLWLLFQ